MHPSATALHALVRADQEGMPAHLAPSLRLSAQRAVGGAKNVVGTPIEHFTYVNYQARTQTYLRATSALADARSDTYSVHTGRSATAGRVCLPARAAPLEVA
jgi:hypothetical protein